MSDDEKPKRPALSRPPIFFVADVCLPRAPSHAPSPPPVISLSQSVRVSAAAPAGGVTVPPAWPGYAVPPADYKPLGRAKVSEKRARQVFIFYELVWEEGRRELRGAAPALCALEDTQATGAALERKGRGGATPGGRALGHKTQSTRGRWLAPRRPAL